MIRNVKGCAWDECIRFDVAKRVLREKGSQPWKWGFRGIAGALRTCEKITG